MTSLAVLLIALGVVALALVVALAVEFHASHQLRRRVESNERVNTAAKALIDWLVASEVLDPPDLVTQLSDKEAEELFVLVGIGLQGSELDRLRTLAHTLGITDRWLLNLNSRRWWHRHRALAGLAALAVDDERPIRLLADNHPHVRARALVWVGRLDFPESSLELTVGLLADSHGVVRAAARSVLSQSGPRVAQHIAEILDSGPDRQTLLAALDLAAGIHDVRLEQTVAKWLSSSDIEVRAHATKVAIRSAPTNQAGTYFEDSEPLVRAAALQGAARTRRSELAGLAGRRLEDYDWQVRSAAAAALKQMSHPGTVILRAHSTVCDPSDDG